MCFYLWSLKYFCLDLILKMFSSSLGRSVYRSDWVVVTRLYRGPMLCIIMIFMLGLNVR